MMTISPCLTCKSLQLTIKRSSTKNSANKYNLLCSKGHIICQSCMQKKFRKNQKCLMGEVDKSHKSYQTPIQCLKSGSEIDLSNAIKTGIKSISQKLANSKLQLAESRLKTNSLNSPQKSLSSSVAEINPTTIKVSIEKTISNQQSNQGQRLGEFKTQEEKILHQIKQTKRKIKEYQKKYWNFLFVWDLVFAVLVLAGLSLQGVEVVQFFITYNGVPNILIAYVAILAIINIVIFLCQTRQQMCDRFDSVNTFSLFASLFTLCFHIIFIPFSVAINTYEIANKNIHKNLFFIPTKFPFEISVNYAVFICKIGVYWYYMMVLGYPYSTVFQQITFIWSFIELVGFIYLNIRYNQNRKERAKKEIVQ